MDRGGGSLHQHQQQYCTTTDGEFSLPEGVDLVGVVDTTRKSPSATTTLALSPYNSHHPNGKRKGGGTPKPTSWKSVLKLVVINMFVCALVLGYALVGSFVFLALENNRGNVGSGGVLASTSSTGGTAGGRSGGGLGANLTSAIMSSIQNEQVLQELRNDTVLNIWNITLRMNILYYENWTEMTNTEVGKFQKSMLEKFITVMENVTVKEATLLQQQQYQQYHWTFPRAFLFALTTLTTIGYGGIGPKTSVGKVATMVYAIFGIPIMLWYLSNVGSLLAKIARFVCSKVCCCCWCCCCCSRDSSSSLSSSASAYSSSSSAPPGTRKVGDPSSSYYSNAKPINIMEGSTKDPRHQYHHPSPYHPHAYTHAHQPHDESSALHHHHHHHSHRASICFIFTLCVLVLLGYVCFGAWVVSRWEKWKFLDSFYFCFLTLTTISFGDSRSHRSGRLEQFKHRTEWFCSFYILFGMALTSMFFNILHEEISRRFKKWKQQQPPGTTDPNTAMVSASTPHPALPPNVAEFEAMEGKVKRHNMENSYSVHFMNYAGGGSGGGGGGGSSAPRNYTEETLLSNSDVVHRSLAVTPTGGGEGSGGGGGANTTATSTGGGLYDDQDQVMYSMEGHHAGLSSPREMYTTHPVFPR